MVAAHASFHYPVNDGLHVVGILDNVRTITAVVRKAGIQIFIVPHRRELGD
jgi:hypothetical protein